jgi:transposase-like protein
MGRSSKEKTEFWDFVLAEHGRSGLSVREFCRREGVSEPSFYQWRKKRAGSGETSCEQRSDASGDFLRITVVDTADDRVQAATSVDSQMTSQLDAQIVTPGGYQVQLSNAAQASLILQSLLAIERVVQGDTRC